MKKRRWEGREGTAEGKEGDRSGEEGMGGEGGEERE